MADETQLKQAKIAFDTLCEMLDEIKWKYEKDEERLVVTCSAQGDDLPIDVRMEVSAERQGVSFMSELPFTVPEDKRVEVALAIHVINYALADGSFDYNLGNGRVLFRMTSTFKGSLLGKEAFEYILDVTCGTVDDYNDKLLMIMKDRMTIEELVKFINEE